MMGVEFFEDFLKTSHVGAGIVLGSAMAGSYDRDSDWVVMETRVG
jgi:hypothetical protein